MKRTGACLPLFSWGTALGMGLRGFTGGRGVVLSKRDGGVLGRTFEVGGRNFIFGGSEVVRHCPL